MPKYRVIIKATQLNIPREVSGTHAEIEGFYTTRYVSAKNEEAARKKVLSKFLTEDKVKLIINTSKKRSSKKPELEVDEIEKVSFFSNLFARKQGLIFYQNEKII